MKDVKQYGVLRVIYERVQEYLEGLAAESGLFRVVRGDAVSGGSLPEVSLGVGDVSMTRGDKSGERIIAGELRYESPTVVGMALTITICGGGWAGALEAVGCVIQGMKDMGAVSIEGYGWHGLGEERVYLEPALRPLNTAGVNGGKAEQVTMSYQVSACVNSGKGSSFKRVERREIRVEEKERT